jgi:hypothetical protein
MGLISALGAYIGEESDLVNVELQEHKMPWTAINAKRSFFIMELICLDEYIKTVSIDKINYPGISFNINSESG